MSSLMMVQLFQQLPPPGDVFPVKKREKWLAAAAAITAFEYPLPEPESAPRWPLATLNPHEHDATESWP